MKYKSIPADHSGGPEKKKTDGELLTQAVLDYIGSHYKEKFSLQAISGELFVNGSYLLRVFKKHTGYTPLAYHNHIRCEQAKMLLAGTDDGVAEIGEAVGYVSSAHFSHVFRKETGCTPTEYRLHEKKAPQSAMPDRRSL